MTVARSLAEVAWLIGDPGRANMLTALLDGRALTASELAHAAGVAPATASGHLARLLGGQLLAAFRQGRHRYFRLASSEVAAMLEHMMVVAAEPVLERARATPRISPALREARTCYDHLAGRLAVALADAMAGRGQVMLSGDGGEVTPAGLAFLSEQGIDLGPATARRRPFCKPCLDWSERRPHIAGAVGAALATRAFELRWIARMGDSRAVRVTEAGRRGFLAAFGVRLTPH